MLYTIGSQLGGQQGSETCLDHPLVDFYIFSPVQNAIHIPFIKEDQLLYLLMATLDQKRYALLIKDIKCLNRVNINTLLSKHFVRTQEYLFINFSYRNNLYRLNQKRVIYHFNDLVTR